MSIASVYGVVLAVFVMHVLICTMSMCCVSVFVIPNKLYECRHKGESASIFVACEPCWYTICSRFTRCPHHKGFYVGAKKEEYYTKISNGRVAHKVAQSGPCKMWMC